MSRTSVDSKILKDQFERAAWEAGQLVCGVDEVGRGCLAGPVVVGACILYPGKSSRKVKDSKLLTEDERQAAYNWIIKNSWYGIGIVTPTQIDTYNIYQATLIAMKRAVMQVMAACPKRPNMVLIDAMPLKLNGENYKDITVHYFPQGERKSSSIAAASIIAKVRRDALMTRMEQVIPGYGFASHKGYATDVHCTALRASGKTIIHRNSFLSFLDRPEQLNLIEVAAIQEDSASLELVPILNTEVANGSTASQV